MPVIFVLLLARRRELSLSVTFLLFLFFVSFMESAAGAPLPPLY